MYIATATCIILILNPNNFINVILPQPAQHILTVTFATETKTR